MITLICGPSSVGKSTLYERGALARFMPEIVGTPPMELASDLENGEPLPSHRPIHYNMMRPHRYLGNQPSPAMNDAWTFRIDAVWERLRSAPGPKRAVLLVTSLDQLRARVAERVDVERHRSDLGAYDGNYWSEIYTHANLPLIYSMFVRELRAGGFEVVCAASKGEGVQEIDSAEIFAFLRRAHVTRYTPDQIAELIRPATFEYQRVQLPHGLATSGQDRDATADLVLPTNLAGQSVLDVGSALGALCFEAERRGAARVVGLEPRESRFRASIILKEILNSDAEIRCEMLDEFVAKEPFDHVLLLNVVHHMKDPIAGLKRCAALTRRTLAVEFPDFRDPILASAFPEAPVEVLNKLPVIGVSSQRVDQTFIFTPAALERILMDHDHLFARMEVMPSPMANRTLALFHK